LPFAFAVEKGKEIVDEMGSQFDPDMFTKPYQLTKTIRRSPYPAISPENPSNSQTGKLIVITGGGTGLGAASSLILLRAKLCPF
jgi:hypothetical protein